MIDGPFGAASEDVFKFEVTVLVGAGIGVTPFASVLKSIWYRVNYPTKATKLHKVYFFWICRDKESFEWFQSLLLALESQDLNQFIEIHTFLTGRLRHSEVGNLMINDQGAFADTVTGLRARTRFGRPNLDAEFERIRGHHEDTDVGVFFCGPKKMGKQLHACCAKFSQGTTQFVWHKACELEGLVRKRQTVEDKELTYRFVDFSPVKHECLVFSHKSANLSLKSLNNLY
ncbi:hypothetical protein BGZ80_010482 [Entomortierella chlamydospora]|uniref:Ferric reductase NAD binding domain-containing protein n=1 Tax=Entomortierella chlamydospora TaxID=101097 RepID=A0A9P6T0B6_9FUNG|nr:hypothetical protein BGZ80_010482 [Entomortierella chlamydospora]